MLSRNFRWVLVSNILIRNERTVPSRVPIFSFDEIETILRNKFSNDECHYAYHDGQRIMRIRRVAPLNPNNLILLISIGDKNVPEIAYEHFPTGEITNNDKGEDDGVTHAAHVIISKTEVQDNQHLMLIEKVPGISISSLEAFFRHLFNDENIMKSYSDEGEEKTYRPIFEITGHLSATIGEALATGKLQDVEFVNYATLEDGHDEYTYLQDRVTSAKFVMRRGMQVSTATNTLERLLNQFKSERRYTQMFVRIKTKDGQTKQTEIDTAQDDVLAQFFQRNESITDFENLLDATHLEINPEVVSKMLTKMVS